MPRGDLLGSLEQLVLLALVRLGDDAYGMTVRREIEARTGRDLSIGAIRNMMNPNQFGDPGKMSDSAQFVCRSDAWTNPNGDSGGVHSNSGVPNHAFALMVDGGSFNGRTVTGIGFAKAAKIQYRALTTYLTSGSGFADNANALNQSCSDLIGTLGITSGDCTQVATAIAAVEMTNTWPCTGATPPPATYCPAGGNPVSLFTDGFESGGANWTVSSTSSTNWGIIPDFAKTGVRSAYGEDVNVTSDHRIAMASAVTLPANARMSFDHAFEFEHSTTAFYDGGVLEYSTNNGASWIDAGSLIDAGQPYNGTLSTSFSNPLGGRTAFARSSFGYTATRLNLASLAGQSVRFRFRVATDVNTASLGWAVDNVRLYTCGSDTGGGAQPPTSLYAASIVGNTLTLRWTPPASGPAPTGYLLEGGVNPGEVLASIPTGSTAAFYTIVAPTGSFYVRMKTLTASGPSVASNEVRVHVNVPVAPSAPANLLGMATGNSVALAWLNTFGGGSPANVILDVTGTLSATVPLGTAESFQFTGVPNGTYTFSLRAQNGGGVSPSSNSVTLTFPSACSGAPQAPTNLLATRSGNTIFVFWDPPTSGAAPTSYVLDVTGAFAGSFPTTGRALNGNAGPGTYNFSVRAANPCGNGPATAVQSVTIP